MAGPLQLGHGIARTVPIPIAVEMTGGCSEMKTFSPFPLCRMPGEMRSGQTATVTMLRFKDKMKRFPPSQVWVNKESLRLSLHIKQMDVSGK